MKNFLLSTILLFISINSFSQRYLTTVFPNIDSIIAGTYGNSINVQSTNQNLLFDFYEPSGDTELKRPLIIYIHGGGFTSGSRSYPSVKKICREMAKKGYAVANIDYRLDPNFLIYNSTNDRRAMTDAMHDAKQAIRYFKSNAQLYKLDTNMFFIGGESAGAATAMMASFVDKQVEMNSYPMANPNNPIGNNNNPSHSNDVAATLCLCGLMLDTNAIEPTSKPLLWTHGDQDTFVPISLSFNIVLRALNIGIPIQTKVYSEAIHCPWYYGNPNWEIYLDSTINDVTTFLYPLVNTLSAQQEIDSKIVKNIFPNPTSSYTRIKLAKNYKKVKLTILSSIGTFIEKIEFKNTNNLDLNLEHLNHGIYFITVETEGQVYTKKIVKN